MHMFDCKCKSSNPALQSLFGQLVKKEGSITTHLALSNCRPPEFMLHSIWEVLGSREKEASLVASQRSQDLVFVSQKWSAVSNEHCTVCRERRNHLNKISGSLLWERSLPAQPEQELCGWKTSKLHFPVYTQFWAVENQRVFHKAGVCHCYITGKKCT